MATVLMRHKRERCYNEREEEDCMNFEQSRFQNICVCQAFMLHTIHFLMGKNECKQSSGGFFCIEESATYL